MELRAVNGQLKPTGAFRLIATGYFLGAGAILIPAFALATIITLMADGGRHLAVSVLSLVMTPIIIAMQSVLIGGLVVFGLWLYCKRRSIRVLAEDEAAPGRRQSMSNSINVTYDRQVDAAYIYLKNEIEPGGVANTYTCDIDLARGMINLDFDRSGQLVGIEVLSATALLPGDCCS